MSNVFQQEQKILYGKQKALNLTVFSDTPNSILAALDAILISVYLFLHKNVTVSGCLNKCCLKHWNLNESAKLNEEL